MEAPGSEPGQVGVAPRAGGREAEFTPGTPHGAAGFTLRAG